MSKQSSIEWLVTELNQMIDYIPMNKWDAIADIIQQAKQMHKEEIERAYYDGGVDARLLFSVRQQRELLLAFADYSDYRNDKSQYIARYIIDDFLEANNCS